MSGGNRGASHRDLLRLCEEYLQARGAWTLRIIGGIGQRRGSPDMVAVLHGRMIAVEGKTGRGVLSQAQQAERARLEEAGAVYVEARSVDDVENALLAAGLVRERIIQGGRRG